MAEKRSDPASRTSAGMGLSRLRSTLAIPAPFTALMALLIGRLSGCVAAPAPNDTAREYGEPPTCDDGVLYAGATLIDAEARVEGGSVCVVGERMEWVSADPGAAAYVGSGKIVQVSGKFIVPGLVDAHVHLATSGTTEAVGDSLDTNLRANLAFGVTQVMDLGGPTSLFDLRDRLAEAPGSLPAPRIAATGPFLTAVGSHPCETFPDPSLCTFVATPTEADIAVATLNDHGADGIKVALADAAFTPWGATPRLEFDVLEAIIAAGGPVFAHVDTETDALDAMAAGVAVLAHPPFGGELSAEGVTALSERTPSMPVLSTISAFAQVGDLVSGSFDPDDPALILLDGTRQNWQTVAMDQRLLLPGWIEANVAWAENVRANMEKLHAGGAVVLPSSDAGYLFVPHGWALHRELRELEALGMSPRDVLVAATLGSREILSLNGGRIATGQPADFLILASDPDLTVANLAEIETVVLAGIPWTRDAILSYKLPELNLALGSACLAANECASGACDPFTHTCVADCEAAWDVTSDCGEGAWCMPESGVATDPSGVCHDETPCDLYAQDCAPGYYAMACIPYDEDTNACWVGGTQSAGERCDQAQNCASGLYCSPLDAYCYPLCNPETAGTCDGGTRCTTVEKEAGGPWFGLCM